MPAYTWRYEGEKNLSEDGSCPAEIQPKDPTEYQSTRGHSVALSSVRRKNGRLNTMSDIK
jgi:hypothetical protein